MNRDTIIQFLLDHGPIRDDSPARANAIKRSWSEAQILAKDHPEYTCSEAAWGYHVKNLEDEGRVLVQRPSARVSTYIAASMQELAAIAKAAEEASATAEPEPAELAKVTDITPPQDLVVPPPDVVVPTPTDEPLVRISVELPASRAAQILAGLNELSSPAGLEPSQITVLVDGYRDMTVQLQNFVSEVFAAWLEMTEKIDRIEAALATTAEPLPVTTLPNGSEVILTKEKPDKPIRPRLSAVPQSVKDKDLRNLYGMAAAQGYDISSTNGGHIRMAPQKGANGMKILTGPTTPSDHRSIKNLRAQLKRAGLEV